MTEPIVSASEGPVVPVDAVTPEALPGFLEKAAAFVRGYVELSEFKARAGQVLTVPDAEGRLAAVLFGLGEAPHAMGFRALSAKLPAGDYRIASAPKDLPRDQIALAFALGTYRFDRYKTKREAWPRLVDDGKHVDEVHAVAHACALARDMVNTPANDLGPLQIETIAREIAEQYGAKIAVVTGDALLEANYPAVHAVGRAAHPDRAPRMIELTWGKSGPKVAIIGKGVVFDTGGLDIKPTAGMRLMKKDMGGAAHALALGRMVMAAKLPVRLTVLVPAVENAIGDDAMRPGDVLASRKGLNIEVGNTDAEGRLILADALARAAELEPDLTLDLATLTGAARIALGPQIVPFYASDDALAGEIEAAAREVADPVWRMPLWAGYDEAIDTEIADVKNDADPWAGAGSITAALFLKRFAPKGAWAHFDIFAWNPKGRPGHPVGAEAQAIRALYAMLKARFA